MLLTMHCRQMFPCDYVRLKRHYQCEDPNSNDFDELVECSDRKKPVSKRKIGLSLT